MTNQEVLKLQRTMNAEGYRDKNGNKLVEDGLLGTNTTYALQKMLNAKGFRDASGRSLAVDGIWGPSTQAAYNKYTGSTSTTPRGSSATRPIPTPSSGSSYKASSPPPAIKPATAGKNAAQKQRQEVSAGLLNNKPQAATKPLIAPPFIAPTLPWLNTKTANDPLKVLEKAMLADLEAQEVFSTPEKTLNEQIALNAMGIPGADGKPVPENGIVDLNTLTAWDTKRHGSGIFGNANSAIMRVVNGKDGEQANAFRGLVPSLTVIDPLQSQITDVVKYINTSGKHMLRYNNGERLFMVDQHFDRIGQPMSPPHLNVETGSNASNLQRSVENKLNHKEIPAPVYDVFHDFDKVKNSVKTGGKALGAVGIAIDAYDLGNAIYYDLNDEDRQLGRDTVETAVGVASSWAGGFAGAKLGAMGGAALGSLVCPGLGTLIGGFIGGTAGGAGGAYGGEKLGGWFVDQAYD